MIVRLLFSLAPVVVLGAALLLGGCARNLFTERQTDGGTPLWKIVRDSK